MLHVLVILVVIGFILWAVNNYIPMEPTIKKILNIAVVIFVCLWLLSIFVPGWWTAADIPVRGVR
jgi:hypothetical protein